MKLLKLPLIFIVLGAILLNCSSPDNPADDLVCTEVFEIFPIVVLNPSGEPADSVEISVISKETGDTLDICGHDSFNCNGSSQGTYTIMHDGFLGEINEEREEVIVTGSKRELAFEEDFAFRSGVCHVEKLAGPDTVSLELTN